jgi:hypothetical protein
MGSLPLWESYLKYEATMFASLPHTVVYIEAGYSDGNAPACEGSSPTTRMASGRSAKSGGASGCRGSPTVLTSSSTPRPTGGGALLNRHPTSQGVEALCNPPGRGLGPRPTTNITFAQVDTFLWTATPGVSSGPCTGGTASGTWWFEKALGLAARAQAKLGPGFPKLPY